MPRDCHTHATSHEPCHKPTLAISLHHQFMVLLQVSLTHLSFFEGMDLPSSRAPLYVFWVAHPSA
jgi:hypothetical protein